MLQFAKQAVGSQRSAQDSKGNMGILQNAVLLIWGCPKIRDTFVGVCRVPIIMTHNAMGYTSGSLNFGKQPCLTRQCSLEKPQT